MDLTKIIKNAIDTDKITIGTDSTLKELNNGTIQTAILAKNRHDIETSARLSGSKVETYEGTNLDLGATARKPFAISVLGIKK